MSLRTTPLHPDLGVEVHGIDLAGGLTDALFTQVRDAFHRHSLLLFRGQRLSPVAQEALTARFGTPKVENRAEFNVSGHPQVSRLGNVVDEQGRAIAFFNRYATDWHTDGIAACHVDAATLLHAVEAPAEGGDTLFASTATAFERLTEDERAPLRTVRARYSFHAHNDRLLAKDPGAARPLTAAQRAALPPVWHDLVQRHPVTGREVLYFVPESCEAVEGMDDAAGQALLARLLSHVTAPRHVYRHRWRPGDLLVWDNHASMHSATEPSAYLDERRLMHRSFAYMLPTARPLADLAERNALFAGAADTVQ